MKRKDGDAKFASSASNNEQYKKLIFSSVFVLRFEFSDWPLRYCMYNVYTYTYINIWQSIPKKVSGRFFTKKKPRKPPQKLHVFYVLSQFWTKVVLMSRK